MPSRRGMCRAREASASYGSCSTGLGHQPHGRCRPGGASKQNECTQHCNGLCTKHDSGEVEWFTLLENCPSRDLHVQMKLNEYDVLIAF